MKTSRIAGLLLVLIGLASNKWTLETFVVSDGLIGSTRSNALVGLAEIAIIVSGIWLLVRAPQWRRPAAGQLVLLVISTGISIGFVEVALRITQPALAAGSSSVVSADRHQPSNFEVAAETGWRMIPSRSFEWTTEGQAQIYAANAQGFRSPRDFSQVPARFIGLAGDSFAWGLGISYAETFGARMENAEWRPGLQTRHVLNVAMPGFGIDQIWQSVRTQLLPRRPGLVIVAFIDDDFNRSLTAYRADEGFAKPRFVLDRGVLRPQTTADTSSGLRPWLRSHSASWRLIEDATIRLRPFGEWWALNTAMLDAIAADCRNAGVPVLFVRLPQIDGAPFPALARHMERAGSDYLDLGSAGVEGLHFPEDRHLNARGHEYVAEKVLDYVWRTGFRSAK